MSRLYTSCEKCPLDVFLDCLFDKEYSRLIIEGYAPDEALVNTWQNLYAEYCQLTQNEGLSEHLEALQECNGTMGLITLIDGIIMALDSFYYSQELVDILEALGLKPNISIDDTEEQRRNKLHRVAVRAKKLVAKYNAEKERLDAIEKENTAKSGSRADYDELLASISKEQGYHVKATDITVAQFVRMTDRLKRQMQQKLMNAKNR